MKKRILTYLLALGFFSLYGQDYKALIAEGTKTVDYICNVAEAHFDKVGRGRGTGYKQFKRWEYNAKRLQDENGLLKSPLFYYNELERYNSQLNTATASGRHMMNSNWEELGPTYWNQTSGWNPGVGRITSMTIDPANTNHIIVGAPQGGVWKTTNGGTNWTPLTDNLTNIYVNALAMDPTNSNTYFWGSNGGVIFKSTDAGATWNTIGNIPNGNINKILIHPTNTNIMYVSSQFSGIYKSTNGGATFTKINTASVTGYDVEFKPGDPNTVYATGINFFISTDGGATFNIPTGPNALDHWTQVYESGTTNWDITANNQNNSVTPRTGIGMAMFYIGNFSQPVTKLVTPALDLSNSTAPQVKFSYTNVQWAGDIDELRVYFKTSANGLWLQLAEYTAEETSWADITLNLPSPTSDYYIAFEATSNYGRGLTLDDVSVESTNEGVIFSEGFESTGPNQFSDGAKMIGVSDDNPSVVYVLEESSGRYGGLHKSTDSGAIFTKFDHGTDNYFGYSSTASDNSGQAPRDMDIVVNPNDADDVHIAGILSWRSTDGGANLDITSQWIPQNANTQNIGYCHADIDIMTYQNGKLYVGSDGGIFVANNPTAVDTNFYTDLSSGLGIRQFYRIGVSQTNPVVVTGGSQDNGTSVYRTDGTWADWMGADGMESFVDKDNSQLIYGTVQFGSIYRSINGGASVNSIGSPENKSGNWITPLEQDPIASNVIYAGYDEIYKSSNGGGSWTSISQNFGGNVDELKIAPSNNLIMYMADGSNLWKTSNGGNTNWSALSGYSGNINYIAVHPTDPNKVAVATTSSNKVFISTNGGTSWTTALYDLPNFSALALVWDTTYGEDILYLGMNYGIYYLRHSEGETSWKPYSNGLPNVQVNELEINTAENKIYAATYGRGLWRSNVLNPASLSTDDFVLDSFEMYPNPTTQDLNLRWNQSEEVSVRIYNTLGKLMYYGKALNLQSGLKIDISDYTDGIYFVKLNTEAGEITKKLIVK